MPDTASPSPQDAQFRQGLLAAGPPAEPRRDHLSEDRGPMAELDLWRELLDAYDLTAP
ncbi:hypothetical protein [Phenylobacterium sp.]|uniref:hypothetical protein n=1 Tax=Phenylobacterium sp. TaxID=1871053 RepID=UPI0026223839|nr:hypothetical protein [Phenylobacterium sp.]